MIKTKKHIDENQEQELKMEFDNSSYYDEVEELELTLQGWEDLKEGLQDMREGRTKRYTKEEFKKRWELNTQ